MAAANILFPVPLLTLDTKLLMWYIDNIKCEIHHKKGGKLL